MIVNFLLVALLFGASKKKFNPYAAAAVLGAIKGVLYLFGSRSMIAALAAFVIFGGLAALMVYLLSRIGKKEEGEEHFTKWGHVKEGKFKWESIPLVLIILMLLFIEYLPAVIEIHP